MSLKFLRATLLVIGVCLLVSPVIAKEKAKLPETTKDGLQLQHHTKLGAVYLKPGASLADYNKVKIVDCYVAFEKDWQRNFNRDSIELDEHITTKEMQKIKTALAAEFPKVFTKVLKKGGYQVVDDVGKDVLLLRPAIINLTVTAPDLPSAGMRREIVSSNGSMTLYMELYDSQTSAKFAEVIDAEEVGGNGFAQDANRVTNKFEFDATLEAWAKILLKRLDEAHGKAKK
jgi:hypothetical protein